ncbi:Protein arginine N-methyltransferase 1 [Labilithrix luteola]|uniref:Protein arginine N-methyltransferase 1 n=1 Tax=Labilithrix luteola TaxID=1391654 RepID=A0A0K1Q518_9BACT|nr:class I SAM-dependent methyltransferase [Labilithrix luteola]AKV00809.1 Protein arginine N-methyltransferase 1 [Labilithrix luteola]
MYSVLDYGRMASDSVRMDAYARAIARAVKPGSVVLDLGAGTGIFSLLAVRAGAARVHAVDLNPALWLVPELARANGVGDKIVIHHGSSLEIEPPEQVDVIVSDMRGVTPLCSDHVNAIRDARARWLKPGGTLIPTRDRLFVGLVESSDLWNGLSKCWESFEKLGFRADGARQSILNSIHSDYSAPLIASSVLSTTSPWATLDYATYDGASLEGTVDLTMTRRGTAHGLSVWFEATVFDDIAYASAPGWQLAYGRYFMPFLSPVVVEHGDTAHVTLRADARGDRWAWDTTLSGPSGADKARFRQSTFLGTPTSPADLLRQSMQFKPSLSERGSRLARFLESLDGTQAVQEIADRMTADEAPSSPRRDVIIEELRDAVERYAR